MFPIISVNPDLAENVEQLGTKRKYWFRRDGVRTLFKAEERKTGEDWAEKVACELARLIGLPHVHYDLAKEQGTDIPGVVCASCAPPPLALVLGNMIMLALVDDYPTDETRKYGVKQHTVQAVAEAIGYLRPPTETWMQSTPEGIETALDVFVGYVMLDAWIANQDRHHQNWGGLLWNKQSVHLAPSFDHGAALARNVSDAEKLRRLESKDKGYQVGTFAGKAKSGFFASVTDDNTLKTHEAARAFAELCPGAAEIWRHRIAGVDDTTMKSILDEVPPGRMTAACKRFTLELLTKNQRLLAEDQG